MIQNEMLQKVGVWIKPRFKKYEIILALVTVIGFALMLLKVHESYFILQISLSILGILYFFNVYAPIEDVYMTGIENFIKYLLGWSLSIITIGITFTILRLKGNEQMLFVGTIATICILIYSIIQISRQNELSSYYKPIALRSTIYIVICLFLLLTPKDELKRIGIIRDIQIEPHATIGR